MSRLNRVAMAVVAVLLAGGLCFGVEASFPDIASAKSTASAKTTEQTPKTIEAKYKVISVAKAKKNIGKYRTVVGRVSGTKYANRSNGKPTFLNIGGKYPKQKMTVVIWGDDLWRFSFKPHKRYRQKKIAVSGKIVKYGGKPQIKVTSPSQIKIL